MPQLYNDDVTAFCCVVPKNLINLIMTTLCNLLVYPLSASLKTVNPNKRGRAEIND